MKCAVCNAECKAVDRYVLLGRHAADLNVCPECGFLFFKSPHWLAEAYSDAIATTDTGILLRNRRAVKKVGALLRLCLSDVGSHRFLDYAGGYGLFTRAMRDAGFDFYWADPYCENILAKGFEHQDAKQPYEVVTAFEVFEHVEDPIEFVQTLLDQGGGAQTIVFTTNLYEGTPPSKDWWYYSFETGQHISFYQARTLRRVAERTGMRFITQSGFHVLTRSKAFTDAKIQIALSRFGPWVAEAWGARVSGKSESDHEALVGTLRIGSERT